MKKIITLLLFTIACNGFNVAHAQSLSVEETKRILCSNKWFLRRLEQDGKMFTVPKEQQGTKIVFKSNGTCYEYLPGEKESDAIPDKWEITKTKMIIGEGTMRTVYSYRLENLLDYMLYLEDEEEDGPTLVYEKAEKADANVETKAVRTESFNQLGKPAATEAAKYRFTYTKGEKMGTQRWKKRDDFPKTEIQADWKEDFHITNISYIGSGSDKKWLLITNKNKYIKQLYQFSSDQTALQKSIEDLRKNYPGYYVSHISYGDGKWVMVGSLGTGFTGQTTILGSQFPEETIKENWKKDYHITDMEYGGGKWTVVMSKGSTITKQHLHTWDSWQQLKIDNEAASGDYLTEAVKQGDKWYMIFSKDKDIYAQYNVVEDSFPSETISSRWKSSFSISRAFYY